LCRRTGIGSQAFEDSNDVDRYTGIHFEFSRLRDEVQCVSRLAKPFLLRDCHHLLSGWESDLVSIASSRTVSQVGWQISEANPLRTKVTRGYEPAARQGAHEVWGELSFLWEVRRVSLTDRDTKGRICLSGNASTKVRICKQSQGARSVLAQWQIEVGTHDSPGWHFHVGLCGEGDDLPFPHWLSVPRVPGLMILPSDAVDFLLGELFQTDWQQTVSKDCYETAKLGRYQSDRINRLGAWHTKALGSGGGSAWNRLKHCKPHEEIFVE
jgi:hypothetical protein